MQDQRLRHLVTVACARLRAAAPPVYVREDPTLNAFTMGLGGKNILVLNSALIREMPPEELLFVVGHELGHLKFGHTTWLTLTSPLRLNRFNWVGMLIGLVFNTWSLRAEYTADRAGLVAVGSGVSAVSALHRIAAGAGIESGSVPDAGSDASSQDTVVEHLAESLGTHPFLHHRTRGVLAFARAHPELLIASAEPLS